MKELKHYGVKGMRWGVVNEDLHSISSANSPVVVARKSGAAKLLIQEMKAKQDPSRAAAMETGAKVRADNEARMKSESAAKLAAAKGTSGGKGSGGGKKKSEAKEGKAEKTAEPKVLTPAGLTSKLNPDTEDKTSDERIEEAADAIGKKTIADAENTLSEEFGIRSFDLFLKAMGDVSMEECLRLYQQAKLKRRLRRGDSLVKE